MLSPLAAVIIGSIMNGVCSSTPSPGPGSGSDFMVAADPTPNTLTIYNDNSTHVINNGQASLFDPGTIVVTNNTTLRVETNGYIQAPDNGYKSDTDWPAIRLSIGSLLYATGGSVYGSLSTRDGVRGGEAIEIYNGQFGPETASYAYFYDGINVNGGDSHKDGMGGTALHIHGFGTSVFIHGGNFKGGKGSNGDHGLSIYTSNGGNVNIFSGSFEGEMEVGDSSVIAFYGCFKRNGTEVTGTFADETELEVNVNTVDGGEVVLISVSEQECETAPSVAPSPFPTLSTQPTVAQPNGGSKLGAFSRFMPYGGRKIGAFNWFILLAAFSFF